MQKNIFKSFRFSKFAELPYRKKKVSGTTTKQIWGFWLDLIHNKSPEKCLSQQSNPWLFQSSWSIWQSYAIKSAPWTILWFRILGISSVENIKRLCVFMFQTWDNIQLLKRVLWISAELSQVWNITKTKPLYIFNRVHKGPPSRHA